MKFAALIALCLTSLNVFASGPVVSQIDPSDYATVAFQGWAKSGDKEVVAAFYYTDSDSEPAACEVYYKPSFDSEFYLQGWAVRSSPELCVTIANNIAANLEAGFGGSMHSDSSAIIDEGSIVWEDEALPVQPLN